MKLEEVREALEAQVVWGEDRLEVEIQVACAADLMSDVLAFIKPHSLLLTGLTNVQSVRTADVAEVKAVVYVRGKPPDREAVELAKEKGIAVLTTRLPMYESCGRLYRRGLRGGSELKEEMSDARRASVHSAL
jgi:predicted transcriptional regulator